MSFADFYGVFGNYSPDLRDHLDGYRNVTPDEGDFIGPNEFNIAFAVLLCSTLLIVLSYYYLINRPKFSRWFHWGILLLLNMVINFSVAFIPYNDLISGNYFQSSTNSIHFTTFECLAFGLSNMTWSIIFFIVVSFMVRWWSLNAKGTPIPN